MAVLCSMATKETIAVACPDSPSKVRVWAENYGKKKDGTARFYAINGAYVFFIRDGLLTVEAGEGSFPAQIVWRGSVPREHARDYNDAINWIEEQLEATR